jgi:hemerythrin-like domain-containing protein
VTPAPGDPMLISVKRQPAGSVENGCSDLPSDRAAPQSGAQNMADAATHADNAQLPDRFADEALSVFADSHVGIIEKMQRLRALPAELAARGLDDSVRRTAAVVHRFFNDAVLPHHDEEEHELFPALRHCAQKGDEAGLVQSIVHRLEREHRDLEEMWDQLEPSIRRIGRGKTAQLDAALIDRFTTAYIEHARFEEASVLPLADRILKSGDRSALALALAMRRMPHRAYGYV